MEIRFNAMKESPIILTLDAGGTNFVFSAMKDRKLITDSFSTSSHSDNLEQCLEGLMQGFKKVISTINQTPAAISFAFPGPANYQLGIIGDLPNFQAFADNTPLGPILEKAFGIPVYINNDGNLFAYGEATSGMLPEINKILEAAGSNKRFKNLIGITLGTGIGCGIVINDQLLFGDNDCGAEIHNTLNRNNLNWNCEESISTRAVQRVYSEESGIPFDTSLLPLDIYQIAKGESQGNKEAALASFKQFGTALGSTICNIVSLVDGLVVLGGGLTKGWDLFGPHVINEINREYKDHLGGSHRRLSLDFFDLTQSDQLESFAEGSIKALQIPGTDETLTFDAMPRTGVVLSKMGANKSTMLGAYDFAVSKLQNL